MTALSEFRTELKAIAEGSDRTIEFDPQEAEALLAELPGPEQDVILDNIDVMLDRISDQVDTMLRLRGIDPATVVA